MIYLSPLSRSTYISCILRTVDGIFICIGAPKLNLQLNSLAADTFSFEHTRLFLYQIPFLTKTLIRTDLECLCICCAEPNDDEKDV